MSPFLDFAVVGQQLRTRVDEHRAILAVHHQLIATAQQAGCLVGANHRRQAEATRQNRRVRGSSTKIRHPTKDGAIFEENCVGRAQFRGDDDPVCRRQLRHLGTDQMSQYAVRNLQHILAAAAQIGVLHPRKDFEKTLAFMMQGPGGIAALFANETNGPIAQGRVVEHEQVGVDEEPGVLGGIAGNRLTHPQQLIPRQGKGAAQALFLGIHIGRGDAVVGNFDGSRLEHHGGANGNARRRADTCQFEGHSPSPK